MSYAIFPDHFPSSLPIHLHSLVLPPPSPSSSFLSASPSFTCSCLQKIPSVFSPLFLCSHCFVCLEFPSYHSSQHLFSNKKTFTHLRTQVYPILLGSNQFLSPLNSEFLSWPLSFSTWGCSYLYTWSYFLYLAIISFS